MTTVFAGLGLGAVYAMVALGYNVVYLSSRIFNFAQAQYVSVGAFLGAILAPHFNGFTLLLIPIGAIAGMALALLQERLTLAPFGVGNERDGESDLIVTVGVAIVIEGMILVLWGDDPRKVPFPGGNDPWAVLGGTLLPVELALVLLAVAFAVALSLFLSRTPYGLSALAAAEDPVAAQLRGVEIGRVRAGAFLIAGLIGGAGAAFIGAKTFAVFDLGTSLAVISFVGLALGGFGSQLGAVVGCLLVGVFQALVTSYAGSEYTLISIFLLLLLILLARPQGLFGRAMGRPA